MRLLIVTQKVDRTDPILGFFHRWIEEFAKHCKQVTVVGQLIGEHELPSNVCVFSLRKEEGRARWMQVLRFWTLQWKVRREYDAVLVHMTPIWVVLGAPLWFVLRKPMYLWYEIRRGSWKLSIALRCVRKVFAATKYGLPIPSTKLVVTGHGIDTKTFYPAERERQGLLAIGRITRIKHLEDIIECLPRITSTPHLTIAGGPITKDDERYMQELQSQIERLGLRDRVTMGWIAPEEISERLQRSEVLIHAAGGGLDKAILEAMACGCLVLSASEATEGLLPALCQTTREDMPRALKKLLRIDEEERGSLRQQLRQIVKRNHNLSKLIERLVGEMV